MPQTQIIESTAAADDQQQGEGGAHGNNGQNCAPTTTNHHQQKEDITSELRKYILLLASLVATVTYGAGFSPPGDVWQDTAAGHLAGDPIIQDTHRRRYLAFFYCNATAFAASLVVIVIILILSYLDDNKEEDEEPNTHGSNFVVRLYKNPRIAVRTLKAAMLLDLLSLMGAYAAGTCRDTFTTVYSSLLVAFVFFYLAVQMAVAVCSPEPEDEALAPVASSQKPTVVSGAVPKKKKVEEEKAKDRFRKVLMLLATFAVSITYVAGMSTPGGFWDTAGAGYLPGDPILKDRHGKRLAVFFGFNTTAFVASLLIIVVLLDRKLRERNAHVFIVIALISLIGAYNAGSCRETDTTVYVFGLIPAVLVYISFLYFVLADHIHDKWKVIKDYFIRKKKNQPDPEEAAEHERKPTEKEKAADKARSLVMLLATLAATITYQAGLDPPGGVWQDNSGGHMAGDPILLTTSPRRYKAFFYCNSVSLVASLVAIVLVQRKLMLKHHVLEAVMILDLFGLIGAYAAGSCRDVNTSIHAMALAGAVLVYVVIHVVFITLDDDTTHARSGGDTELVERRRKRLLLFAILAATITYQAGLTPPGGFLLQDDGRPGYGGYHAGDPVLLHNFPRRYKAFFYCNSVSFMLSIALIILLVNPNMYRPAIRTHALSVCTAAGLFGLMGAYSAGSTQHLKTSFYIFALVAVVIFFIVVLFLIFWFTGCQDNKEVDETNRQQERSNGGIDTRASEPVTATGSSNIITTSTAAIVEREAMAPEGEACIVPGAEPSIREKVDEKATGSSNNASTPQGAEAMETNNSNTAQGGGAMETTYTQGAAVTATSNGNSTTSVPPHGEGAIETMINREDEKKKKRVHANRKYLMLLGILVASVTYQAGLKPPGRAWQSNGEKYKAGDPVMHDNRRPRYLAFFYSNSTSFMASVVVILLLLVPPEKLIHNDKWHRRWIVVMNTTIVLDLLGLLGAYAAGSSRRWKTSVYVLLLVIAVLVYMAFHLLLSCMSSKRNKRSQKAQRGDSPEKPEANGGAPPPV